MRTPSDLPPRQRRGRGLSDRGRVALIVGAVLLVVLLLSARFLSGFYIDYLWHESVDRSDVFWGVLGSKILLFVLFAAVFIALAVLNLVIADRLAPLSFSANMHPVVERFHELFGRRLRIVRFAVAIFFGLLFALPATGHWQDWLLFRNSQSFGINDAQFGNDIGFYMFRLPFITFVLDWLFAALVFITMLVRVHARAQRRHRHPAAAAEGSPRDQGAHRRAAGVARRGEGRRLLGHALRADHRTARLRAGRHLLGRQGAAAGGRAADAHRAARRRPVPVDVEDRLVAAAGRRLGSVGRARAARRRHLSRRRSRRWWSTRTRRTARRRTSSATSTPRVQAFGLLDVRRGARSSSVSSTASEITDDVEPAAATCDCSTRRRWSTASASTRASVRA